MTNPNIGMTRLMRIAATVSDLYVQSSWTGFFVIRPS